ncbi:MAG: UvrD-helicase domain-containing protein [Clostridia bacterium]|nr:UvrD-helicase domain-containing protein [Clostridia bacterium]
MINLDGLNPPQREAVMAGDGPLLLLAGAGSGKTRVLTQRIARLIEDGVRPWAILAITFTNKAAREMQNRVRALIGDQADDVWVSTFHACCARILRRDIDKLGYERSFSIYDDDDQMSALKAITKSMGVDDKRLTAREIKSCISDAKNRLLSPQEWMKESDHQHAKTIARVYARYDETLKASNALDFDDLILKTILLLTEHPPVLDYYRQKFDHILVDEYQDTNMAQYELIRLLSGAKRNVCVVGDDDQSIYTWRGADIRNILEFEKDFPGCRVIKLEQNYRSTGNILDAANHVIAFNTSRKDKALWTEEDEGEKIQVYRAQDERDEAVWVARQVLKWQGEGQSIGDAAILYRTNSQSRVLEEAMVSMGVPYRVYGGMKFYDRMEVRDLIAYLRALYNPTDDRAVLRIINTPRRGIGDSTVAALQAYAEREGVSLLVAAMSAGEIELPSRAAGAVTKFSTLMEELMLLVETQRPDALLKTVIEKTGYRAQFEGKTDDESVSRLENIGELENAVAEYLQRDAEGTLGGFLENVSLVTDTDSMAQQPEVLTLMTLHSAKGLEFGLVVITGMEEGIFPTSRSLYDQEKMEEERRLCYVGITRAKKRLCLSWALTRSLYGQRETSMRSRFLDELPRRVLANGNLQQRPQTRLSSPKTVSGTRMSTQQTIKAQSPLKQTVVVKAGEALNIPGVSRGMPEPRSTPSETFVKGDRVEHATLGKGTVLLVFNEGRKMTIRFDSGVDKTFLSAVAPLKRSYD